MRNRDLIGFLVLFSCVALAACHGSGDKQDAGSDGDGGNGGDPVVTDGCPFPFTPLETHAFSTTYGEGELEDIHVHCAIDFNDVQAQVLVKAEPTGFNYIDDPIYEAKEAFACRDGKVEPLASGMFYYEMLHHGWEKMGVGFGGFKYDFDFADWCVGGRPCNPTFEIFAVRRLSDDSLVAEKLPANCSRVTQKGNPRPLVPRVRVPAEGTDIVFSMGSNNGDADEQPVHPVTVRPMRLDIREATWKDFALFLTDHGNDCDGHPCVDTSGPGVHLVQSGSAWAPQPDYQDHPAVHVTWYGAEAYCLWRSWLQLPTEAQWEMAASAAGTREHPWGDEPPACDLALYDACGAPAPDPACSHAPGNSREGICDLSGNVAEWVSDWYQADFYSTCTTDCQYPRGPTGDTGAKVIRGGGFTDPAPGLRAADRGFADPATSSESVGVRCTGGAGEPLVTP
jgi:sulfatase modifying factor 1